MSKKALRISFAVQAIILVFAMIIGVNAALPDSISAYDENDVRLCSMPHVSISVQDDTARLWGVLPIKSVSVTQTQERELIVCGTAMGIQIYTKGVVVVETGTILSAGGMVSPGQKAGICHG